MYKVPKSMLIRPHLTLSFINLTGKLVDLGKTIALAIFFGASATVDAYYAAIILPFLIPAIVKGLTLTAFIPKIRALVQEENNKPDWSGVNTVMTSMVLCLVLLTIFVWLFSYEIIQLVAPGLSSASQYQASVLLKVMCLVIPAAGLNALITAISHSESRFFLPATESFFVNGLALLFLTFLHNSLGVNGIAYGFVVGYAVFTGILIWRNLSVIKTRLRIDFSMSHRDSKDIGHRILPLLLGFLGANLMTVADTVFASYTGLGSLAALNFALLVSLLPFEVFTHALLTTQYPIICDYMNKKNYIALVTTYKRGVKTLLAVLLPLCGFMMFYRNEIIDFLFQRGAFSSASTALTASVLLFFSLAIIIRSVVYFNYRFLQAAGHNWLQLVIGLLGLITNVILNFLFYKSMGVQGIALATVLATLQNWLVSSAALYSLKFKVMHKHV